MSTDLPEPEFLRKLLRYDPDTGFIYRLSDGAQVMKTPHIKGYLRGVISGYQMLTHRVAWVLHNGAWPNEGIDHINGDKTDNRIENLRDVPTAINAKNSKLYSTNKSGHVGVFWCKTQSKWVASMWVNNKCLKLGRYNSIDDAIRARKVAEIGHGFTDRHGHTDTQTCNSKETK